MLSAYQLGRLNQTLLRLFGITAFFHCQLVVTAVAIVDNSVQPWRMLYLCTATNPSSRGRRVDIYVHKVAASQLAS
jgi:hypothetical protein